jgi:hypothetical protein
LMFFDNSPGWNGGANMATMVTLLRIHVSRRFQFEVM